VIWEFGGEAIPEPLLEAVRRVADAVPNNVASLLDSEEVEALTHRATWLLNHQQFPVDDSGRSYPWPLV
jgi:hypothetical protein